MIFEKFTAFSYIELRSIAFSPDGQYIVSTEPSSASDFIYKPNGFRIRIWDLQGNQIKTYQKRLFDHRTGATGLLHVSSDGQKIALSSAGKSILRRDDQTYIWHLEDKNKVLSQFSTHNSTIENIKLSPDGNHFAILRSSKTSDSGKTTKVELWRLQDQKKITEITRQFDSDYLIGQLNICFSPNGQRLLTHSLNGLEVWDLQGNLKARLPSGWPLPTKYDAVSCENLISPNGRYTYVRKKNQFEVRAKFQHPIYREATI